MNKALVTSHSDTKKTEAYQCMQRQKQTRANDTGKVFRLLGAPRSSNWPSLPSTRLDKQNQVLQCWSSGLGLCSTRVDLWAYTLPFYPVRLHRRNVLRLTHLVHDARHWDALAFLRRSLRCVSMALVNSWYRRTVPRESLPSVVRFRSRRPVFCPLWCALRIPLVNSCHTHSLRHKSLPVVILFPLYCIWMRWVVPSLCFVPFFSCKYAPCLVVVF